MTQPFGPNEVGKFARGSELPIRWKHTLSVSYNRGPWSGTLSQRFSKGYLDAVLPGVESGDVRPPKWSPKTADYSIFDLFVSYRGIKNLVINAGVKNILDKDPPFSATYDSDTGAGSSWKPRVADPRGRAYVLNFSATRSNKPTPSHRAAGPAIGDCGFFHRAARIGMHTRRRFLITAAALALCARLGAHTPRPLIKPPRLRRGNAVAIIPPSGHISPERLERSVRQVESLGLKVRLGHHVLARSGNYAGSPQQRLADLLWAFRDPDIKAIWPSRGGSGAAMLLPHLDYARIRARPKIVLGYSDLTALLIGLYHHTGLVCFHGIVSGSNFADYSLRHLEAVLFEGQAPLRIELPSEQRERALSNPEDAPRTLRSGSAEGPLVGGNLAVVSSLVGTPDAAPLAGHLLFLEEIGEAPYRIDRMLYQLQRSPEWEQAAGFALGVFRRSVDPDGADPASKHTLAQVLEERFASVTQPAAYGLPFGHIAPQASLPLGVRARLDADRHTLTLLEPAVS